MVLAARVGLAFIQGMANTKPKGTVGSQLGLMLGDSALRLPEGAVTALRFSNDGRLLAAGTDRGDVALFAAETGALVRMLVIPGGTEWVRVLDCAFSADGARLAVSRADVVRKGRVTVVDGEKARTTSVREGVYPTLAVFDVGSGELLLEVEDPIGRNSVALSPDGAWVAVGASGGHPLLIRDARTGTLRQALETGLEEGLQFSPDGALLVAKGRGGRLVVFDVESGSKRTELDVESGPVTFVGSNELRTASARSGRVHRTAIDAGRLDQVGELWPGETLVAAVMDARGETAAGHLALEDGAGALLVASAAGARLSLPRAQAIALSPDGRTFARALGMAVTLVSTLDGRETVGSTAHSDAVIGGRFGDDGRLTTWSVRESITWDPSTRTGAVAHATEGAPLASAPLALERQLRAEGRIPAAQLSDASCLLLDDGPLVLVRRPAEGRYKLHPCEVWDAARGERMASFVTRGLPYHAVLSPSRTRLALSFYAGTVSIHEWPNVGAAAVVTIDPRGGAPRLAWSPDGNTLGAGNEKSAIWLLSPGAPDGTSRQIGERACGLSGLAWSRSGGILAASNGKQVSLWDEGGALRASIRVPWRVLAFSLDSSRLAVGDSYGPRILDVAELLATCAPRAARARP